MNLKKIQNLPNTTIGKVLNMIRWFRGYSPLCLSACLTITYKCNLNCEFCYQAKEKREIFPDMSIKDALIIEKNIRGAFSFMPRVHLFGGEPTVNKDFIKILKHFSLKNYKISMTTNGIEINKYIREFTTTRGLVEIIMSLNTMDFEKLLTTLQLFKQHEQENKIYINIACPINHISQNSLVDIVRYFENSYAKCITFQHTTFTDRYNMTMDFNSIKKQVEEIKRTKYKIPILFLPDIKLDDVQNYYSDPSFPHNRNKCIAPWVVPFILPNGEVIPCDGVDITMGNLKKESLKKIWNNEKYRRFRENIQKCGISHPICKRCCHRQYY